MPNSRNTRKAGKKRKSAARKHKPESQVFQPPQFGGLESQFHSMGMGSGPERRAQKLYSAWELADPGDRVRKAKRALEVWPDCADAWVLLAENQAGSLDDMHEFHAAGVAAGERSLGKKAFTEDVGHFRCTSGRKHRVEDAGPQA